MYSNTSEKGIKAIKIRWSREKERINKNLSTLPESRRLLLTTRICAYIAGDGSLSIRCELEGRKHHDIRFYPDILQLAEYFSVSFYELYSKKTSIKKLRNHYKVNVSCKTACIDLLKLTKYNSKEWIIPKIASKDDNLTIEWLRAFFDCEAYVSKKRIDIQIVNKRGIFQIKNALLKLGINSRMYVYKRKNRLWSTNYILCILKREDRIRYLNIIGFNHQDKLKRLKDSIIQAGIA